MLEDSVDFPIPNSTYGHQVANTQMFDYYANCVEDGAEAIRCVRMNEDDKCKRFNTTEKLRLSQCAFPHAEVQGRNQWMRTQSGMHGLSTFSKSPTTERQITNQVIKPKVDDSIESMHIVTLDFQGVH